MRTRTFLIPLLAPALLAVGCASEEKKPDPAPTQSSTKAEEASKEEKVAKEVPEDVQRMVANFKRVYFDFDKSEINADTQAALRENAEIMKKRADVKVEVQGHADERGTNEYNLALGDKRAQAVKDYLVRSGVDAARIATVSYGEEKPLTEADSETGFSKNRRAEFRVTWGEDEVVGTTE